MKIAATIAEYNPFHLGHEYMLKSVKSLGFDGVIAVMSGNFVQRGDCAVCDKRARAKAALQNGADLVVELPVPFATASAERFAYGAAEIIKGMGCVDAIAFGSESGDARIIEKAAKIISGDLSEAIKPYLSEGMTFAAARQKAVFGIGKSVNEGDSFNAVISTNQWDNEAGYKLIDFIMTIPEGLSVTDVTPGDRLSGGEVLWNLEAETGKLRVVYFDANENTTLTVSGEDFPAELFTISFKADTAAGGSKLDIAISGMSVKLSSDSADEAAMIVVNTENARGTVTVVEGISFSAVCLYTGDDVDLIPATKKAVAVAVTGISGGTRLRYNDGTNAVEFKYSAEISEKTGVSTYVALVDAAIPMEHFVNDLYFTIPGGNAPAITFGDSNGDGILNAQDALAAVDAWLRKGEAPDDDGILTMNVNGDSRINTFDALGIVEKFVSGSEYGVVTKAATITTNQ